MEVVLPIAVEILSLRVLREVELEEAEWVQARYEQLNLIEEKRMKAICHGQLYQKRMMKAHDKGQLCIRFNPIYLVFCIIYHLFWAI